MNRTARKRGDPFFATIPPWLLAMADKVDVAEDEVGEDEEENEGVGGCVRVHSRPTVPKPVNTGDSHSCSRPTDRPRPSHRPGQEGGGGLGGLEVLQCYKLGKTDGFCTIGVLQRCYRGATGCYARKAEG